MDQITPGMTYGLTALTVAIYSIPLLFVIWRLTKVSIRTRDLVFLGMLGIIFLAAECLSCHSPGSKGT